MARSFQLYRSCCIQKLDWFREGTNLHCKKNHSGGECFCLRCLWHCSESALAEKCFYNEDKNKWELNKYQMRGQRRPNNISWIPLTMVHAFTL